MITLKKVKLNTAMSEETLCFSADIYEDGKLVAHVSNRGHGGCNDVHPAKGLTYDDVKHLDTMDKEGEIMDLAETTHFIKSNQSKGFVLLKGEQLFTQKFSMPITKLKKHTRYATWLTGEKSKFVKDGYELLNTNL